MRNKMKTKSILFLLITLSLFSCSTQEKRYSITHPPSSARDALDKRVYPEGEVVVVERDLRGFDKRVYSENEKMEIERMFKRIEEEFKNLNTDITLEFVISDLQLGIKFAKRDWTKNIGINIHDQFTLGREAIGPTIRINDSKYQIDYCWFYGKNCPIPWETVETIIKRIYNLYPAFLTVRGACKCKARGMK